MDDLISRQEAIDALILEGRNVDSRYLESERIIHEGDAIEAISMLSSAQPEIIYCKDCRHNGSFDTDCPINWNGKEYCSFGER